MNCREDGSHPALSYEPKEEAFAIALDIYRLGFAPWVELAHLGDLLCH